MLRLAKNYPSIKRDTIIQCIKDDFHQSKTLTERAQIETQVQLARQGLEQLSMYSTLDPHAPNWNVDVAKHEFEKKSS